MGSSINTNISSLFAQRKLNESHGKVLTGVDRLSSGLRINSAQDDAAGLSISSRMTSHIRSSNSLIRGINDGVSLLQVAGGGLRGITDVLQRARELAIKGGNQTLSPSDRKAIDNEFQQLMTQVNHIANNTEAFGKFPLKQNSVITAPPQPPISAATPHITDVFPVSGTTKVITSGIQSVAYIPAGAEGVQIDMDSFGADDDIQIFTRDGKHLAGTALTDPVWSAKAISTANDVKSQVFLESSGFLPTANYDASTLLNGNTSYTPPPGTGMIANYNGMQISYSGDGHPTGQYLEQVKIDKTAEPLLIIVVGSGAFSAKASWDVMPAKGAVDPAPVIAQPPPQEMEILVSATPGSNPSFVTIEKTPSDTATLGLVGAALDPLSKIAEAINALDAAITTVTGYAARHGAVESRLDAAVSNASISMENTSAARSRIMDADFAIETAQLSADLMRSSAGTAMTAQANIGPKLLLSLLNS